MPKIHATAIVEDGAVLGADVEIGPFSLIGAHARLGDGVRILSHVVIAGHTEIGARTIVHPHAVLGGGPQFRGDTGADARLRIGADNVIREHVTMNAGSAKGGGLTSVGERGYFMAYSHVAHDCHVGNGVTFANSVALGGHVSIEDGVNIGGLSAIQQFSRIGRYAFVGGVTGVPDDVIPYGMVWGDHARLEGLNLIGLKRRGIPRERIHALRAAFRAIFFGTGRLIDRAREASQRWKDFPEVDEVVRFILAESKRPICMPSSAAHAASAESA
ncbi:MAG TPA: acyl-ACP--UDP-N-acetylglucosamine O-acyltransferase [Micropepsaceae bacterium]|jgi:UDP-N-acetylglucosamine acyltransferase|nr:acyl-ACP--UDP-N-acetylglucosamine O-acyltransferase [Micropepsaceae bacterium]